MLINTTPELVPWEKLGNLTIEGVVKSLLEGDPGQVVGITDLHLVLGHIGVVGGDTEGHLGNWDNT